MLIDVYNQGEKFYNTYKDSPYKQVENPDEWLPCPKCSLKPLVWEFDNGRFTVCGCGSDTHDKFTIRAESVNSYLGRVYTYTSDKYKYWYDEYNEELKENWNAYCETGDTEVFKKKKTKIFEEQGIDIF